jgi:phospholipid transport system substrate-binding protein
MLASSFIVLLTTEALASAVPGVPLQDSVLHVSTAPKSHRALPSPTVELRKSTEALRKTLARRHPAWSPEAEAQAASVQTVVDGMLDFEEIARRTLLQRWDTLSAEQRREFLDTLQKLLERRPLERGLKLDFDSTVTYHSESVIDDQASVSSLVTSYATGRPNRRAVEYKLCYRTGRWRIYDVIVEGVSLVQDYRDQFSKIIAQDSFEGLLRRMHKKAGGSSADAD